jgi:hypothetical protein
MAAHGKPLLAQASQGNSGQVTIARLTAGATASELRVQVAMYAKQEQRRADRAAGGISDLSCCIVAAAIGANCKR